MSSKKAILWGITLSIVIISVGLFFAIERFRNRGSLSSHPKEKVVNFSSETMSVNEATPTEPSKVSETVPAETTKVNEQTPPEPPKKTFVEVVPITFHVSQGLQIPFPGDDVVTLRVSPDGSRIVLSKKANNKTSLAIVGLLDNKISNLDLGLDDYADPSWNRDGTKIVFAGSKNGSWEIYVFDLTEKKLLQVTKDPRRKKVWPRFSPYKFDDNYRIAYASEEKGRKDIWWVRESGQYDQPITYPKGRETALKETSFWKECAEEYGMEFPTIINEGGDNPEWSSSGTLLLYRTKKGYSILGYSYDYWWRETALPTPTTSGVLVWSPNQTAFLEFDPVKNTSAIIPRSDFNQKRTVIGIDHSAISYFPDGRGFAYVYHKDGLCFIAIEPYDDPLGDIVNLWMFTYTEPQKNKIGKNQLLFLSSRNDQIYKLFDSERYYCGSVDENAHARPYLITSDAVLEAYYSAFAALYAYVEQTELIKALELFSRYGSEVALERNSSKDVVVLFQTGLALLKPEMKLKILPEAREEAARIENGTGKMGSLFGDTLDYSDFYIRGKYERDTLLAGYFRSLKWFQVFIFDLSNENERGQVSEILTVVNTAKVNSVLEKIYGIFGNMVGQSRYYNPMNLRNISSGEPLPTIKSDLPWVNVRRYFRLLPSVYTLDAYIFDELVTHADRSETVGTSEFPRTLPKGMDIMAAFGSDEAFKILIEELKEGRFANYEETLKRIMAEIKQISQSAWDANIYQNWLNVLDVLVQTPTAGGPAFMRTGAWKRKQLNTALSSWVNLRYETIAVVEQGASECGEAGYERLNIGRPRGYVEPIPDFFHKLDEAFDRIATQFDRAISDNDLKEAITTRILDYRTQLKDLEIMARKELNGQQLSDEEYDKILEIGGIIEHFILIMGSMNGIDGKYAVGNPDPINKIVDVQKDNGARLYEAIGYADEINVAVPFFGQRQIVKGPVYSYYEFTSSENLNSKKWRESKGQQRPIWIKDYYEGESNQPLYEIPDQR